MIFTDQQQSNHNASRTGDGRQQTGDLTDRCRIIGDIDARNCQIGYVHCQKDGCLEAKEEMQ